VTQDNSLKDLLRTQLSGQLHRRLFVGFSGGLDSTVLLHVAAAVTPGVTAIHVDHGLHPDSACWEKCCGEICLQLGVRMMSERANPADDSEAAARAARYAVFDDLLGVNDLLLLGHHQGDQAETVLLRVVQGRAPLGMLPARRLSGGARILRPWMTTPRATLLRYARQAGLDWMEDPSNASLDYDRNFLRQEIMPRLVGRWPEATRNLARSAATQSVRDALLDYLADAGLRDSASDDSGSGTGREARVANRELDLRRFPVELPATMLRLWLRSLGEFLVTDSALAEFARQFEAGSEAKPRLVLKYGVLRRHNGRAVYSPPEFKLRPSYHLQPPGVLKLPHGKLSAVPDSTGFHAPGVLEVRFRRGGERLRATGKTRSVKKLLHAAGVPAWQRPTWPMVYSENVLLSVPGIATADTPAKEPRWCLTWQGAAPSSPANSPEADW